jgi:N-acetylglutamate synthase-like GNAT family acetyltransferase
MISLRAATVNDAPSISSLVRLSGINPLGLDWRRFIVAVSTTGEVIGCGQIKPHRDGSDELASLAVSPAWQGQGIARKIIDNLCKSHQGDLYLMCRSSLGSLYERCGFQPIDREEMPIYFRRISRLARVTEYLYKDGETLLVMKRINDR